MRRHQSHHERVAPALGVGEHVLGRRLDPNPAGISDSAADTFWMSSREVPLSEVDPEPVELVAITATIACRRRSRCERELSPLGGVGGLF